jgi:hypothetical protein
MIKLKKKQEKKKQELFLKSNIGNIKIFFIDKIFKMPFNVKFYIAKKKIFLKGLFGLLVLKKIDNIFFF